MIRIKKFRCNGFEEHAYLVWAGTACAIIDPGFDGEEEFDALYNALRENGITPGAILLTHAHPDHVYGVHRLCEEYGIPVYMNRGEEVTLQALAGLCRNVGHPDVADFSSRIIWVGDGERIFVSKKGLEFKVLLTPGHTAGGVCYLCRESGGTDRQRECESGGTDRQQEGEAVRTEDSWKVLFSGDTLFAGCIGRSDLPGGDYNALMQSIFTKILPLEGDIDVLPGHGHSTTIADERMKNPFLLPFEEVE